MKKILTLLIALTMSTMMFAQFADFQKSVAKYKNVSSLTATATRTTHKAAVAKDKVESGTLYVKKPNKVLIVNGGDKLKMNGTKFTIKKGMISGSTDSNKDAQYRTFHDVLESIFTGGSKDISKNADVKITKSGSNVIITITPNAGGKKMMFNSFVVTIDGAKQELRSIRLNQKKDGYTLYTFSNYKLGASVNDSLFK